MTKALLGIMAAALAGIVAISAAVMSRDDAETTRASGPSSESVSQVHADATGNVGELNDRDQAGDLAKQVSEATTQPAAKVSEAQIQDPPGDALTGTAALERASKAGRYLFVFFYKDEGEQTRKMREVFDASARALADRADAAAVKTTDPREKQIVDKFNVSRAPMPLVLAVAPNGVITGGFPAGREFDEEKLRGVFASPCMEKCLKGLQDGKLIFLCAQNTRTGSNDAAMQGVRDFKADTRFAQATEIVTIDPSDPKEIDTLKKLRIDPKISEATTVFLAPPGRIIGTFQGPTNKDSLVATIQRSMSSCSPSSGCCPPKKK